MAWISCCRVCQMDKIILDRERVICHQCSEAIANRDLVKLALSMRCQCRICRSFLTEKDEHFAICQVCAKKIKSDYKEVMRQRKKDKKKGIRRFA